MNFIDAKRKLHMLNCTCKGVDITSNIAWLKEFILKAEDYYYRSVGWHVNDFEGQAEQHKGKTWKKYYDETKFKEALEKMIIQHDCEYGITWQTIEYYLDEYCIKKEI